VQSNRCSYKAIGLVSSPNDLCTTVLGRKHSIRKFPRAPLTCIEAYLHPFTLYSPSIQVRQAPPACSKFIQNHAIYAIFHHDGGGVAAPLGRVALNQNCTTRPKLLVCRIGSAKTGAHFSHDALKAPHTQKGHLGHAAQDGLGKRFEQQPPLLTTA